MVYNKWQLIILFYLRFFFFLMVKAPGPLYKLNEIKYGERKLWKYPFYYTYKLSKKKRKEDIAGSEIKLATLGLTSV